MTQETKSITGIFRCFLLQTTSRKSRHIKNIFETFLERRGFTVVFLAAKLHQ